MVQNSDYFYHFNQIVSLMKSHFLPLILSLILLSACENESESSNSSNDQDHHSDTTSNEVSEYEDDEFDEQIPNYSERHTITVMVDGPDEDFFVEDYHGYDPESIHNLTVIDMVPYLYGADDSSEVYPEMKVIARDNFSVTWSGLGEYSGVINLFYDPKKTKLASSFSVNEGDADGSCILYDIDGTVFIERVYKNGEWQFSGKEPYAVDWTFDQADASLIINDTDNGVRSENLIEIMHSFHDEDWEYFDWIIEKETFNSTFKVNGAAFTGKLIAYQHPTYYDAIPRFELNFLDGNLHGEVKIYTWWGELELHETFENGIFDEEIYKMDESMMDGVAKPIIYIYPENETEVSVNLDFEGKLTHTYPKYNHGWNVTASPDGTLLDEAGKEYYALYWEGKETTPLSILNGTVLKGSETISFLEEELPKMGLNARETNEFIIYWMPYLENNPFNLIHFSSDEYTDMAKLNINPQPETTIRVMMVFQALNAPIEIEKQNLSELYQERKGFTVVEWGGRKLPVTYN